MKQPNEIINDVLYFSEKKDNFSSNYLSVRVKEERILTDKEVELLPTTLKNNKNYTEWRLRKKSSKRFINYLANKKSSICVLDIGCGNGWFSNKIALLEHTIVDGIDVNQEELEQAARVFKKENLRFIYADLFESTSAFENKYDIVTLNASVQYFEDIEQLILVLKSFLKPQGEIHILDSPFYENSKIEAAKQRTKEYYKSLSAPEMSSFYYHHSKDTFKDATVLYSPKKSILERLFTPKDIPFYWIKIN
ncbi:MAG: class I SAM-dependent methyltransferase [Flavobacteriaceae bacterium]|nr:class I SAM-dependent methyltransferase [Flavobacteriaceae bacterium]